VIHPRTHRTLAGLAMMCLLPVLSEAAGFTVSGATVTLMSGTVLSTEGDVTLSHGRLSGGGGRVSLSGDWNDPSKLFVADSSTVSFHGVSGSTSTLLGSNTFYSLQISSPGKTMIFPVNSTQTVQGTFTMGGVSGNLVRLRSSVDGTYGYLINQTANSVSYTDVKDNFAGGGITIRAGLTSQNFGHTVNWTFGSVISPVVDMHVSSLTIHWGAVPTALGYNLEVSTAANFTGTLFSSHTVNPLATSLSITGLTTNTTYHIQIGSIFTGATEYANVGPHATLTEPLVGVQTGAVFVTSITLNWGALVSAAGYRIQASTLPTFATIAATTSTPNVALTTLTITGLAAHTSYYLRVGGVNVESVAHYASGGLLQTLAGGPPQSPAIFNVSHGSITVNWTGVPDITGYLLEASTASNFSGTLNSSATVNLLASRLSAGTGVSLQPNTTYFLRVGALYNDATTYASSLATATLTNPISNAQFAGIFASSITVNWPPLTSAEGYRLEASTSPSFTGTLFTTATPNILLSTLTVTGLSGSTAYYFRLGGINVNGAVNLNGIGAATAGVGVGPNNPVISAVGISSITASWGTVLGANGYVVEASTASDFTGTIRSSASLNSSLTTLPVLSLTADTTYYLRVGALYGAATSYAVTSPPAASTLMNYVTGISLVTRSSFSMTVTWTNLPGAHGYELGAAVLSNFTPPVYSSITTNGTQNTLTVSGLAAGTSYYLRVGALNQSGVPNPTAGPQASTLPGPAPINPTIHTMHITSATINWGPVSATSGYRLEASPTSDFSGVIFSSTTTDGSAFRLTVSGLAADSNYYFRVASLWNGTPNYAATTPPFAITNANSSSINPERPQTILGTLRNGGSDFDLDWREVTEDVNGGPTTIASYSVQRSTALFGTYTPIASVTTPFYSESVLNQTYYYRVIAIDINGNSSAPSDVQDSSSETNRYVMTDDGTDSYVRLPDASNRQLQAAADGSEDVELRFIHVTADENADVLRSYRLEAYRVSTGNRLMNFYFTSPGIEIYIDYASAITPALQSVAPFWINNGNPLRLGQPMEPSATPMVIHAQNMGVYQARSAIASQRFGLQAGAPYPRTLTPNRVDENRRLFFLFNNPNNDPVEISIYDIRNRKVRDVDTTLPAPIPGAVYWDVKDESGCIVPSGIYIYKIRSGDVVITGTVVVAR